MKETKIIIKHKGKLQDKETFVKEYQEELNKYINEGYKIISSNLTTSEYYMYLYALLEKEN